MLEDLWGDNNSWQPLSCERNPVVGFPTSARDCDYSYWRLFGDSWKL